MTTQVIGIRLMTTQDIMMILTFPVDGGVVDTDCRVHPHQRMEVKVGIMMIQGIITHLGLDQEVGNLMTITTTETTGRRGLRESVVAEKIPRGRELMKNGGHRMSGHNLQRNSHLRELEITDKEIQNEVVIHLLQKRDKEQRPG